MSKSLEHIGTFSSLEAIPREMRDRLPPVWRSGFTPQWPSVFLQWETSFPKSSQALFENFEPPVLNMFRRVRRERPGQPRAIANVHALNLLPEPVFKLYIPGQSFSLSGRLYPELNKGQTKLEGHTSVFPRTIQQYYRVSEGLGIAKSGDFASGDWCELPRPRWACIDMIDVKRECPASVSGSLFSRIRDFEGIVRTHCKKFVLLNPEDSRIYLLDLGGGASIRELGSLSEFWDSYCCHILKGGAAEAFDFSYFLAEN